MSEEAGEGIILKKDKAGRTIGIEKLYVSETARMDTPFSIFFIFD